MGKNILVIDDNEAIRESFVLALKDTGYQVDTAETGKKGIKKERKNKYDLIYLDLKMPDMDGIEVLIRIRRVNKETPIYIITAFYKEFFDKLNAIEKEEIDFELIKKPIHSDQILLISKSVLESPIGH